MTFPEVRFNFDNKLLNLADTYTQETRGVTNSWAADVKGRLERQSYVGATRKLRDSWNIIRAQRRRNTLDLRIVIRNTEPTSFFRIVGRGAGKFVPIDPLTDWVVAKGIETDPRRARSVAFLISRAIARRGTQRYRDRENFLGLKRDNTLETDSILFVYRDELIRLINQITI